MLGAPAHGALTETEYQALGMRQSLYPAARRARAAHDLFDKYRAWLKAEQAFDLNLVSHAWRAEGGAALRLRRRRRGAGLHQR